MAELVNIPMANENHDNYPCWVPVNQVIPETRTEIIVRPHVICRCGEHLPIRNHHILKDGTVQPSFYHKSGCMWHVYLKLLDWPSLEFFPTHDRPK